MLTVMCSSGEVRSKLNAVLLPDNRNAPRGLDISTSAAGRRLSFEIKSGSASQALSTSLAVLQDISLFQEIWLLSTARDA